MRLILLFPLLFCALAASAQAKPPHQARNVAASTLPSAPTPRENFRYATRNTFEPTSYLVTGFSTLISEGNDSHPQLGKGVPGFGRYYWRGFLTKVDGNYWVYYILPAAFHENERYHALSHGSMMKRGLYAASRVFIARNYQGNNTVNGSDLLGRGIADGVSMAYYPAEQRTFGNFTERYGYSLLGDAATNLFRGFWSQVSAHLPHHHKSK